MVVKKGKEVKSNDQKRKELPSEAARVLRLLYGDRPQTELEKASKGISGDPKGDLDESALKFLGLGIFFGASEKGKKISIK